MSDLLKFDWHEKLELSKELMLPIESISVGIDAYGKIYSATLWRHDKSGIRITSQVHAIAEQVELSTLKFEHVANDSLKGRLLFDLGGEYTTIVSASKLVIEDAGIAAEAGVLLAAYSGSHLVFLPDSFPFSLAVKGIPGFEHGFCPEWPLENYLSIPMF
jgi:hypothetical protein